MKEYEFRLRAHHGMCVSYFEGKGYSSEFTVHMGKVVEALQKNPHICLSGETDIVCKKCPNNQQGVCDTAEKVAEYDRQVLQRCGLKEGDILPFLEFQKLVYDNILSPGKREEVCGSCQWNSICQEPHNVGSGKRK